MRRSQKILLSITFLSILIALGSLDAALTQKTLFIPTDAGVAKKAGPDVAAVGLKLGFIMTNTNEEFLLQNVLPPNTTLSARVLLRQDDRAGALAWIDSKDVKTIFAKIKQTLRSSFSPELKDLIDETQAEPGKPPRDILSFSDLGVHPDRILIVRVRERLYEFHVTGGKEEVVDGLLNALTD